MMRGEDEGRYWRLHDAIEDELKPITRFDMIWVGDWLTSSGRNADTRRVWPLWWKSSYVTALAELSELCASPSEGVDLSVGNKDC